MFTRDQIVKLLDASDLAVERALVAIYRRQTAAEQCSEATIEDNGVGFSAFDAPLGTYLAKWILDGRHLSGGFLTRGRKLARRYVRQLQELAANREPTPVIANLTGGGDDGQVRELQHEMECAV